MRYEIHELENLMMTYDFFASFEELYEFTGKVCPHCGCEIYIKNSYTDIDLVEFGKSTRDYCDDLNECGEQRKLFYNYRGAAKNNPIALRDLPLCPCCGENLYTGENAPAGFYHRIKSIHSQFESVDLLFSEMREIRHKAIQEKAENDVSVLVQKYDDAACDEMIAGSEELIQSSLPMIQKYLNHLLVIETDIYTLQTRLQELYMVRTILNRELSEEKLDILGTARKQHMDKADEYTRMCEIDVAAGVVRKHIDDGTPPKKPQEPSFSENKPQEPEYEKPGLFNKKKILALNENLKQTYLEKLANYERKYQDYQKEQEDYARSFACYQVELEAYRKRCEQNRLAEQTQYELDLASAKKDHQNKLELVQQAVEESQHQLEQLKTHIKMNNPILDDEIQKVEKLLEEMIRCRKQLYAQNVIYPKYRNMVAIASFNDYFMSGRCTSFGGANGAYDKFEADCRADIVISKLSEVISSLDAIKEGQYMLHFQLTETNKNLSKLNDSMNKAIEAMNNWGSQISDKLESIEDATKKIALNAERMADNTDVIAYASQITAFYSKKNAELTNALGYLLALK